MQLLKKICDVFRNTAEEVFTSGRTKKRVLKKSSDQVWFTTTCPNTCKRKIFHKAKNRYSFIKNKENRDAMKKPEKVINWK